MAYISASEFVLLLPRSVGTITGSSNPITISEVATIIERVSVMVDGAAAAAGYSVPVPSSATSAFAQMQEIVANGAGWKVLRAIFPNQGGANDKLAVAGEYRDAYNDQVKALREGNLALVGASNDTGETSRLLPRGYLTSNPGATDAAATPMIQPFTVF